MPSVVFSKKLPRALREGLVSFAPGDQSAKAIYARRRAGAHEAGRAGDREGGKVLRQVARDAVPSAPLGGLTPARHARQEAMKAKGMTIVSPAASRKRHSIATTTSKPFAPADVKTPKQKAADKARREYVPPASHQKDVVREPTPGYVKPQTGKVRNPPEEPRKRVRKRKTAAQAEDEAFEAFAREVEPDAKPRPLTEKGKKPVTTPPVKTAAKKVAAKKAPAKAAAAPRNRPTVGQVRTLESDLENARLDTQNAEKRTKIVERARAWDRELASGRAETAQQRLRAAEGRAEHAETMHREKSYDEAFDAKKKRRRLKMAAATVPPVVAGGGAIAALAASRAAKKAPAKAQSLAMPIAAGVGGGLIAGHMARKRGPSREEIGKALLEISKAMSDFVAWQEATGNTHKGAAGQYIGRGDPATKAQRIADVQEWTAAQGAKAAPEMNAQAEAARAKQREARAAKEAQEAAARAAAKKQARDARIEEGLKTGSYKERRPGSMRDKALSFTERPRSNTSKKIMAGLAGAVPGAAAGATGKGIISGALRGAAASSLAYPAASYALNATAPHQPGTSRVPWRKAPNYSQDPLQAKEWGEHREASKVVSGKSKANTQAAMRTTPDILPGATRRRIGAMGYGPNTIGRHAGSVALGGAISGGITGGLRGYGEKRAAKAAQAAKKARNKKLALGLGAAGLGAAALGGRNR